MTNSRSWMRSRNPADSIANGDNRAPTLLPPLDLSTALPNADAAKTNHAQVDGWTIAELCRTAAGQFVRQARSGNDPTKFRVDVRRKVAVPDKSIATLKRAHDVAVRISITCESLLFDHGRDSTAVLLPERE